MDLWIRSQNGQSLIKAYEIEFKINSYVDENDRYDENGFEKVNPKRLISGYTFFVNGRVVGNYKSAETVKSVLKAIHEFINHYGNRQVYEMPADDEVK